jgi:catechol 2,3-dioxygenase-like lactoylglutathione lyase family enzyme
MVRGITFVGIPVSDQDIALKFYTESMGFKVATDRPFTDTQRWIELLTPGAETGLALSLHARWTRKPHWSVPIDCLLVR